YVARFQIEFLFRDSKQFTGLLDCQARTEAALDFHFNASLATLNLVRAADLCRQQGQAPHVFSMASWKQCQFNGKRSGYENLTLAISSAHGVPCRYGHAPDLPTGP